MAVQAYTYVYTSYVYTHLFKLGPKSHEGQTHLKLPEDDIHYAAQKVAKAEGAGDAKDRLRGPVPYHMCVYTIYVHIHIHIYTGRQRR